MTNAVHTSKLAGMQNKNLSSTLFETYLWRVSQDEKLSQHLYPLWPPTNQCQIEGGGVEDLKADLAGKVPQTTGHPIA